MGFIKTHHGVTFEASETLKVLSGNSFKTDDEIRYEETNSITSHNVVLSRMNIWVAILIAVISSLVQVGIALYQNSRETESMKAINSLEIKLHELSSIVNVDSTDILKLKEQSQALEYSINELTQRVNKNGKSK